MELETILPGYAKHCVGVTRTSREDDSVKCLNSMMLAVLAQHVNDKRSGEKSQGAWVIRTSSEKDSLNMLTTQLC